MEKDEVRKREGEECESVIAFIMCKYTGIYASKNKMEKEAYN